MKLFQGESPPFHFPYWNEHLLDVPAHYLLSVLLFKVVKTKGTEESKEMIHVRCCKIMSIAVIYFYFTGFLISIEMHLVSEVFQSDSMSFIPR